MILFAHGLEGSPEGTKVRALRAAGLDVEAPDCRGLSLADRVARIEEASRGGDLVLAGSSYGGLASAIVAQRFPERFRGLLLCAPALELEEPPAGNPEDLRAPPALPTVVIHGLRDDIVPVEGSRRFRERSGPHVRLVETDDGHRLAGSLDVIVEEAKRLAGDG
jgi:pimeloyl-ACP methyl ester carboxylesterase